MKINKMLSTTNCNLNANNPQYIIIHETDNTSKGAGAATHCKAQANGNIGKASVHFYVDDTGIYQALEIKHASWNCGDGNNRYGINNKNTISIEICVNPDSNYNISVDNAIALVQYLLNNRYSNCKVVRHYDASRKHCPRRILDTNYWSTFLARVNGNPVIDVDNTSSNNNWDPNLSPGDICTTRNVNSILNLRTIGSLSGHIVAEIPADSTFTYNYVDSNYLGWVNITYNEINGFVSIEYVQKKSSAKKYAIVTASTLNVREAANTSSKKIGEVYKNEKIEIKWTEPGWHYIKYSTSKGCKEGYVSAKYVKEL